MWIYKDSMLLTPLPESVGFVYLIERININENNTSPILYVGKKSFYHGGKKNKGVETDWSEYNGSSIELNEDFKRYGEGSFIKRILHVCYSKSEMTYLETIEQVEHNVLVVDNLSTMKKKYYNKCILGKFYNNKMFTKKDLDRLQEYYSESNHWSYKYYITNGTETKCIIGDKDEWDLIQHNYPEYYIGTNIHKHTQDTKWVTNGVSTKLKHKDEVSEFLLENADWVLGFIPSHSKGMIIVNDGKSEVYISNEEVIEFLNTNSKYELGSKNRNRWVSVTDGTKTKKILRIEIDTFLDNNITFKIKDEYFSLVSIYNQKYDSSLRVSINKVDEYLKQGWVLSNELTKRIIRPKYIWVNNGIVESKVNENNITKGFSKGRLNNASKGLISITKDNDIKYVTTEALNSFIADGWLLGGVRKGTLIDRNKTFVCCDKNEKQKLVDNDNLDSFLSENTDWRIGQFKRTSFNTFDTTFVKNIYTEERAKMNTLDYKDFFNHDFVTIKTTKVSIRKKGKVIFTGYLKEFLLKEKLFIQPKFFTRFIKPTYTKILANRGEISKLNTLALEIKRVK